jgi:hypothetical protein
VFITRLMTCQALNLAPKIRALHDELLVISGGPEDPLEPGRSLHVDGFGGRTELHLAALEAEAARLEATAVLTRLAKVGWCRLTAGRPRIDRRLTPG